MIGVTLNYTKTILDSLFYSDVLTFPSVSAISGVDTAIYVNDKISLDIFVEQDVYVSSISIGVSIYLPCQFEKSSTISFNAHQNKIMSP